MFCTQCLAHAAENSVLSSAILQQPPWNCTESGVAPPAWGLSASACWGMAGVLAAASYTVCSRGSHWMCWGFLYASVAFLSYNTDPELGGRVSAWLSASYILESARSCSGYHLDKAGQRRMPRFMQRAMLTLVVSGNWCRSCWWSFWTETFKHCEDGLQADLWAWYCPVSYFHLCL